jgi:hypothetical protein
MSGGEGRGLVTMFIKRTSDSVSISGEERGIMWEEERGISGEEEERYWLGLGL